MLPLQAALQAVAAMNTILQAAPSVADLHKAMLVAGTSLADSVSQLAVGSLQLADFGAATSPSTLQQAVATAVLAGTLPELNTGQQAARSRGSKVGWLVSGWPGLCSKQHCVTGPAAACISAMQAGCSQSLNQLTLELPACPALQDLPLIVGIAVGAAGVALLVTGVTCFVWRRLRWRRGASHWPPAASA